MTGHRALASILFAWLSLAPPAAGQETGPRSVLYALSAPPSQFEWGCFEPCLCPVFAQSELVGTFVLSRTHEDPLFTYYDVSDVRWQFQSPSGPVAITGAGTYRRGGEFALTEQLTLDLRFGDALAGRFDSGLLPPAAPFPEIHTEVSLHMQFCLDSLLVVDAKPIGLLSADPGVLPTLTVGPNPSAGAVRVVFTQAREGPVDLGVFDVTGRRVRALATREVLPGGPNVRVWDGRRDDGSEAPPGVYVVRLATPEGRAVRLTVRTR